MKSITDDIDVFAIPGFREPVNCFTHFLAVVLFSILSFYLIRQGRGSWLRTASLGVMAFSSVFLLSMNSVYHLLGSGTGRDVMRQMDIAGVFAPIAGTMPPSHAILDRGLKRWGVLLLVWSVAATGITLRTVFAEGIPSGVGIAIFLLFGWSELITCILLWRFVFQFAAGSPHTCQLS